MLSISSQIQSIEQFSDLRLDEDILQSLHSQRLRLFSKSAAHIDFHNPSFKCYQTSEIDACQSQAWPAFSITGDKCSLQCDHCHAKILKPMTPVLTPNALWEKVVEIVDNGAQGMLLTGGSNLRNEVQYQDYWSTIKRIKQRFPEFTIACHTALMGINEVKQMEQAGVDVAMLDIIGAQDTITQVYHLKRQVTDFASTLKYLVDSRLRVVPHIVLGLHYGELLGEWQALNIVQQYPPDALVFVVAMPYYAKATRPFKVPDSEEIAQFFQYARAHLPETQLLLGCARPAGKAKQLVDIYALLAGVNAIAYPADGIVQLAQKLGYKISMNNSCCSTSKGIASSEVLDLGSLNSGLLDPGLLDPGLLDPGSLNFGPINSG